MCLKEFSKADLTQKVLRRKYSGRRHASFNVEDDRVSYSRMFVGGYVEKFAGGAFESTLFFSGLVFSSHGEAIEAALQIGRQMIDTGFDPSKGIVQMH